MFLSMHIPGKDPKGINPLETIFVGGRVLLNFTNEAMPALCVPESAQQIEFKLVLRWKKENTKICVLNYQDRSIDCCSLTFRFFVKGIN